MSDFIKKHVKVLCAKGLIKERHMHVITDNKELFM